MKKVILLAAFCFSAQGQGDWTAWSATPGTAAKLSAKDGATGTSLITEGGGNPAVFGGWQRLIQGIKPQQWYRFRATYSAEGVPFPARQIVARLDWTTDSLKRAGQPDYPWSTQNQGNQTLVTQDVQAPPGANGVKVQLLLVNAPSAKVVWGDVALDPIATPRKRSVVVSSVNLRPQRSPDPVGEFLAFMEKSVPENSDVVLLPEGITVVGTSKRYTDVAEPVPGPTTGRLGQFAKQRQTWLVAGIYERDGSVVYNTSVLIDRQGRVAGKYRKVYIPREEFEGGITPGSDYPVFQTDFGTVGMMICWDVQFADPARALALRGAELILMPIWGGNETLAKARAIENQVFLVSSGYDHPTYIMDPNGEILSRAAERGSVATSQIDLNRRYLDPWLGDMRARFMKELRTDTKVDPAGRR